MAARTLRAVTPADKPKPGSPKSITQAADAGTERELLVALRARIAKTAEDPNCPPRDLAALSRQLRDIDKDIRALDAAAEQEAAESAHVADEAFDASAI